MRLVLTFDWGFETLGHCDHDVGSEHPEDVVEEEAAQQYATSDYVI